MVWQFNAVDPDGELSEMLEKFALVLIVLVSGLGLVTGSTVIQLVLTLTLHLCFLRLADTPMFLLDR